MPTSSTPTTRTRPFAQSSFSYLSVGTALVSRSAAEVCNERPGGRVLAPPPPSVPTGYLDSTLRGPQIMSVRARPPLGSDPAAVARRYEEHQVPALRHTPLWLMRNRPSSSDASRRLGGAPGKRVGADPWLGASVFPVGSGRHHAS